MNFVYRVCRFLSLVLAKIFFRYKVIHRERLLLNGPALVAPNHASYFDPPLVGVAFPIALHYLARKSLLSNPVARWLLPRLNVVPVDQEKSEVGPLKTVIRLLKENKHVLIFPEGQRTFDGTLQPAEPGTGFIVAKCNVPVIPIRIFGSYEALPRSAKWIRLRKITVVIGEPLHFAPEQIGRGKDAYQKISERIMEAVAALECPPNRLPKP